MMVASLISSLHPKSTIDKFTIRRDLLLQELADRFDQSEFLPEVLCLESLLLKAANGDNYESELASVRNGCFTSDLNLPSLEKQLPMLVDVAKQGFVRKVTSIRTISDAMNNNPSYKVILSEIHKLLLLYLIVFGFKATVCVFTINYDREATKQLSTCTCTQRFCRRTQSERDAVEFVSVNDERRKHFGNY